MAGGAPRSNKGVRLPDLSSIKRDPAAELGGVWIDFEEIKGIRFKVARMRNPRYVRRLDDLISPIRGAWNAGTVPEEEYKRTIDTAASETILVDWDGIEEFGSNGDLVPVPYSTTKSFEYMSAPEYADVRAWVMYHSTLGANYLASARKAALGNSHGSSSGTPSTETASNSSAAA